MLHTRIVHVPGVCPVLAKMSKFVGPALPPGFQQDSETDLSASDSSSYGPSLPPQVAPQSNEREEIQTRVDRGSYGPCLPPEFKREEGDERNTKEVNAAVVGPALPPGFGIRSDGDEKFEESIMVLKGPALPPEFEEENSDIIGPLQTSSGAEVSGAL